MYPRRERIARLNHLPQYHRLVLLPLVLLLLPLLPYFLSLLPRPQPDRIPSFERFLPPTDLQKWICAIPPARTPDPRRRRRKFPPHFLSLGRQRPTLAHHPYAPTVVDMSDSPNCYISP